MRQLDHVAESRHTPESAKKLEGAPHKCAKNTSEGTPSKSLRPPSSLSKIAILLVRAHLAKGVPGRGEILVIAADRFLESSAGL